MRACSHEWGRWFPPATRRKGALWFRGCLRCKAEQRATREEVGRISGEELAQWERDFRAKLAHKAEERGE